jgi:hypothetical protein
VTKDIDNALPGQRNRLSEPGMTESDSHPTDGSIGCRIGALIAMLLLALVTLVVWFLFRG